MWPLIKLWKLLLSFCSKDTLAQHQTGETPLGWVNRKLHAFMWMFSRASWLDQGWKNQCRGITVVWKSTWAFWQWRCWSHQREIKDTTGHDNFNPTSLHSRDCKLTTQGVWNGCSNPCINFWNGHSVLNTDAMKLLAFTMQGAPYHCYLTKWIEETLICKLTWNLNKNLWKGTGFSCPPPVWQC